MTLEMVIARVNETVSIHRWLNGSVSTIKRTAENIFYNKQLNNLERSIFYLSFESVKYSCFIEKAFSHRTITERMYIYTLQDGENGLTAYVGSTCNPIQRHKYHRSKYGGLIEQWRANLRRFIYMDVIDFVPVKDVLKIEQDYINCFRAVGCKLLNVRSARKRSK